MAQILAQTLFALGFMLWGAFFYRLFLQMVEYVKEKHEKGVESFKEGVFTGYPMFVIFKNKKSLLSCMGFCEKNYDKNMLVRECSMEKTTIVRKKCDEAK